MCRFTGLFAPASRSGFEMLADTVWPLGRVFCGPNTVIVGIGVFVELEAAKSPYCAVLCPGADAPGVGSDAIEALSPFEEDDIGVLRVRTV
jgi:hypothetical protein